MPQRRTGDWAVIRTQHPNEVHPPLTHIFDVKRARHPQLIAYGGRYFCFWRDDMVDGQLVWRIQIGVGWVQISLVADPRNFYRCIKDRVADLTGDHIDLVRLGHRNEQFGIADTSLGQNIWVRRYAHNAMHIGMFGQALDILRLGVNDGHIIMFFDQMARDSATYQPGATNNNFHF